MHKNRDVFYDLGHMLEARDVLRALERYYSVSGESVEQLIADMESDAELTAAAQMLQKEGPMDLQSAEALADTLAACRRLAPLLQPASSVAPEDFAIELKVLAHAVARVDDRLRPLLRLSTPQCCRPCLTEARPVVLTGALATHFSQSEIRSSAHVGCL